MRSRIASAKVGSPNTAECNNPRADCFSHHGYGSAARLIWQSLRGPDGLRAWPFVVVELPDGRRRSIQIASTDLAEAAIAPGPKAADLPRISVRTLIPLVQHLTANLTLLAEVGVSSWRYSSMASVSQIFAT